MSRPSLLKLMRIAALFLVALPTITAGALFAAAVYLKLHPEEAAAVLAREMRERTGAACAVGAVDAAFFPWPSLALADVEIKSPAFSLASAYVAIRPRLLPLLRGKFVPDAIELTRARCSLALPAAGEGATPGFSLAGDPADPRATPLLPEGCELVVRGASLELSASDFVASLEGVDGSLLARSFFFEGDLGVERGVLGRASRSLFSARDILLSASGWTEEAGAEFSLKGLVGFPGMSSDLRLEALAREEGGPSGSRWRILVEGGAPLADGKSAPLRAELLVERRGDAFMFDVPDLRIGEDRLSMAGGLEIGRSPKLGGTLRVEKFSLPRWFAFARRLPPAARRALDALSGRLDFSLSDEGLKVSDIACFSASGWEARGVASVKNFAAPEIFLDLRAGTLKSDEEFPGAAGGHPAAPVYGHAPLALSDASSSGGRDFRIHAERLSLGALEARGLSFRYTSGAKGSAFHLEARDFYGGPARADLAVSPGAEGAPAVCSLRLNAQKTDVERVGAALSAGMRLGGKLSGGAELSFACEDRESSLAGLGGNFSLRVEKSFYAPGGEARIALPDWSAEGNFSPSRHENGGRGERLEYVGVWRVEARDANGAFEARFDGPVSVARSAFFPLRLAGVPGVVRVLRAPSASSLQRGMKAEISGKFSLDGGTGGFAFEEARALLFGCEIRGDARGILGGAGLSGQGRAVLRGTDLRASLAEAGVEESGLNPALLKHFFLAAAFAFDAHSLAISEAQGRIDDTAFDASANGKWKERPFWNFSVKADALPLSAYLESGPEKTKSRARISAFLKSFDAEGVFEVNGLDIFGLRFSRARIPARLKAGMLECAPVSAALYGGRVSARLRIGAGTAGLGISLETRADDVDLRALCEERGGKASLAGAASAQLTLEGFAPPSGGSAFKALNGRFRGESRNAVLRLRDGGKESVTPLDAIAAEGTVERGVFLFSRLSARGPTLEALGRGRADPEKLDILLDVRMKDIPPFPLRIYGPLNAPKSSIHAGEAVLRALGRLGLGVAEELFDVIGGVLSAPLRLLKK
jgi:AsmA protein